VNWESEGSTSRTDRRKNPDAHIEIDGTASPRARKKKAGTSDTESEANQRELLAVLFFGRQVLTEQSLKFPLTAIRAK
jgi:hypothetical protein